MSNSMPDPKATTRDQENDPTILLSKIQNIVNDIPAKISALFKGGIVHGCTEMPLDKFCARVRDLVLGLPTFKLLLQPENAGKISQKHLDELNVIVQSLEEITLCLETWSTEQQAG